MPKLSVSLTYMLTKPKSLQFWRVVNSLKTWKITRSLLISKCEAPKSARPRAFARFAQWLIRAWVGGLGQFSLEGPYDVIHDVIACKYYVFADSQRSRLLFPVVDYVPAVLTRLSAAFDCKPHEMVLKINAGCPWP